MLAGPSFNGSDRIDAISIDGKAAIILLREVPDPFDTRCIPRRRALRVAQGSTSDLAREEVGVRVVEHIAHRAIVVCLLYLLDHDLAVVFGLEITLFVRTAIDHRYLDFVLYSLSNGSMALVMVGVCLLVGVGVVHTPMICSSDADGTGVTNANQKYVRVRLVLALKYHHEALDRLIDGWRGIVRVRNSSTKPSRNTTAIGISTLR